MSNRYENEIQVDLKHIKGGQISLVVRNLTSYYK